MKLRPIHRASLIALGLFTFLILVTWKPEAKASEDVAERRWPVEVELRADLRAFARPQEVVQDTLTWYANRINQMAPDLRSSWRYEYCCDGEWASADRFREFKSTFSLEFADQDLRWQILNELVDVGFVKVRETHQKGGWTYGWVDLELPVPGEETSIYLRKVGYGIQVRGSRLDHYDRV